jgi:hypothetical protein
MCDRPGFIADLAVRLDRVGMLEESLQRRAIAALRIYQSAPVI